MGAKVYQIRVDAEQAKRSTKELGDQFAALQSKASSAGTELDAVERSAGKAGDSFETAAKKVAAKVAAVTAALYAMKKIADELDRQADIASHFAGSIDEASERTKGLISNLDLMIASNKASAAGLELTAEQFATLSVAAVKFAEATGTDAAGGLDALTTAIATGQERALKPLGIELGNITDKAAKQREAIRQLSEKFGSQSASADSLGDALVVVENGYKNIFTAIATGGNEIEKTNSLMKRFADDAATGLGIMAERAKAFFGYVSAGHDIMAKSLGADAVSSSQGLRGAESLKAARKKPDQFEPFVITARSESEIKEAERRAAAAKKAKQDALDLLMSGQREKDTSSLGSGVIEDFKAEDDAKDRSAKAARKEHEAALASLQELVDARQKEKEEREKLYNETIEQNARMAESWIGLGDAVSVSVEALASGQAKAGQAAQLFLASILKRVGKEAIADGTMRMLKGVAMSIELDPRGPALIGAGAAEIAFGAGLTAGGVKATPNISPSKGGADKPVRPEGAANSGGKQGGGTVVVNINQPIPEDQIGRTQARYDRAFKRRNGGA